MKSRYAADLAPEEVFNEAARILAADRARLGSTNAPIYKGQSISPMSTLTQRARELQSGFNARPVPYSGKINAVLGRPNQINPMGLQGQVNNLANQQQAFNRNALSRILGEQYREAYDPRASKLLRKEPKDLRRGLSETNAALGDIGRTANTLEQYSNQGLVDRLRALQGQKEDRRKSLVGNLEQFGAQRHGYNNLVNAANRNAFEQEANAPFRKMEMLQQSLGPLSQSMGENVLPEIRSQAAKEALQALKAYGVDTNKPVNEWETARMGGASYPGQLVANLPPEILASGATLEGVSPKFRGTGHDQSKRLIQEMMANPSVGDRALEGVPARMQPQVENLETAAQKRLKRDLGAINQQFIQANQYGSPLHIKTAEDRAREIAKATLEQRGKLLEDTTKSELVLGHQQQQANLRQLGALGDQTQDQYQNMLNAIRNTNQLGATKFGNEQAENEDLYKNFQNEAAWEWPHLRGAISREARSGALGDVFKGLQDRNISLDQLAALNTNYSESQRDLQSARENLQTERLAKEALQRQLGTFQQQQQAVQAAEAQRRAAQQAQADEQRRVQEAQRLAALQAEIDKRRNTPEYQYFKKYNEDIHNKYIDNIPINQRAARLEQVRNPENIERTVQNMKAAGYAFVNGQWVKIG